MNPRLFCALACVALLVAGCILFGFRDDRVIEGEAYGFAIGDSFDVTIENARKLKISGEIHEIEFGSGSGAEPYDPAIHSPTPDQKLQMDVDPEVWNDTIYLTFDDEALVEIWRFRSPIELP